MTHPIDQAVDHDNDHQGKDSHQDHENGRIWICLVLASLYEVGTTGAPAEG